MALTKSDLQAIDRLLTRRIKGNNAAIAEVIDKAVNKLDNRIDELENKMEKRFDKLDDRLDKHGQRIEKLEKIHPNGRYPATA